ncbi:MAG: hypothetical protein HZA35_01020 [Parcubacteria group bacterium]|nr:hypothetical protein [Parcubacteria group bacterium]
MDGQTPLPPVSQNSLFSRWNTLQTRKTAYYMMLGLIVVVVFYSFYAIGTQVRGPVTKTEVVGDKTPAPLFGKEKSPFVDTVRRGASSTIPQRTVGAGDSFRVVQKSIGACSGLVPEGWSAFSSSHSDAVDFVSSDKTMYAGYGALGVNPAFQVYDAELYSAAPEVSVKRFGDLIISGTFGDGSKLLYTNDYNQQVGEYTLRSLESQGSKGVVFYRTFPGDGINYSYAEVARFAFAKKQVWNVKGELVARVAASLSCSVQFSPSDQAVVGGGPKDKSTKDENGNEYGYNPQLGTEYVHDENGTNYLVSPSNSWSETGPSGAGYYKSTNTGWEMLKPGRSD